MGEIIFLIIGISIMILSACIVFYYSYKYSKVKDQSIETQNQKRQLDTSKKLKNSNSFNDCNRVLQRLSRGLPSRTRFKCCR
ncbi:MAG: hypothetical protein ACTSRG_15060 [Candidatus Helarchaeota archaeon]